MRNTTPDAVRYHTVSEIAERFRCSADKILRLIGRGEITAVNTAADRGKPRWLISSPALADFEKRRSSGPSAPPPQRRTRMADGEVVNFF